MSESHMRQIQLFVENPTKFLDSFSTQFEQEFIKLLRRRYVGSPSRGPTAMWDQQVTNAPAHLPF